METRICFFGDESILSIVKRYAESVSAKDRWIIESKNNAADCADEAADVLLLQLLQPVSLEQNLMSLLQSKNLLPVIILFEVTDDKIRYCVNGPETDTLGRAKSFFNSALSEHYDLNESFFRTTIWEDNQEKVVRSMTKTEALREILRGCTEKECQYHKEKFHLDLRDSGYYIYLWDLQFTEYKEHRIYKDVYHFLGEELVRECRAAMDLFNGGEVFYISLISLCCIINDLPSVSTAKKDGLMSNMLRDLSLATGCSYAGRYLSGRVEALSDLREAYDICQQDKVYSFFMREKRFLSSKDIESRLGAYAVQDMQASLDQVLKLLRYDSESPKLTEELHHLYIDLLKPMMRYSYYYYCTGSILAELSAMIDFTENNLMFRLLSPNEIPFSSIEQQYRQIVSVVEQFNRQKDPRHKTRRSILIQAITYIEQNYKNEILVPELAASLYVSNTYLNQLFKNEFKMTVVGFIINHRIGQAKKLLTDTDLRVASIAEQVGFKDSRYFTKTFKRLTGRTPREYRANYDPGKE